MNKSNKGMTIVEIIVGLAIGAALLGILAGVYYNTNGYFLNFQKTNTIKQATDTTFDYMVNELTYATEIYVKQTADDTKSGYKYFKISSYSAQSNKGRIGNETTDDMYGDLYYAQGAFVVTVTPYNNQFKLQLEYYDEYGDDVYKRTKHINTVNIEDMTKLYIAGDKSLDSKVYDLYIYYKKDKEREGVSDREEQYLKAVKVYESSSVAKSSGFAAFNILGLNKVYKLTDQEKNSLSSLGMTGSALYIIPYFYVKSDKTDVLMIVTDKADGNLTFSDGIKAVYIPEEDKIYYYTGNPKVTELKTTYNNQEKNVLWMEPDSVLSYKVNGKEQKVTIKSASQIKQFFKKYGKEI